MSGKKQYICACFYKRNIFIKQLNLHVTYENEEQFKEEYHKIFKKRGCSEEKIKSINNEVLGEIQRRKQNGRNAWCRKNEIANIYIPLHPEVYHLKEDMLAKEFIELCEYAKEGFAKDEVLKKVIKHTAKEVYSFPVFNEDFCKLLVEELKHFEVSDLPKGRPNSMNTTGILLEELGLYRTFIDLLRESHLSPLVTLIYPNLCSVDSQRAFIVSYNHVTQGNQSDLDTHFDNAEVTLNVSLNGNYTGGELYFTHAKNELPSEKYHKVDHKIGWGVLHRGCHFHGAMPLEDGERYNLIIWMRSSAIRNKICPMCDDKPVLTQVLCDGDGFTQETMEMCHLT